MSLVCKTATGKVSGRSLTYVLSDATLDRYGDIIEPDGWELDNFRLHPVALFNHNPNAVIGKWANVRIEPKPGSNRGDRLVGDLEPAPPGTTEFADDIRRLIEADLLPASSVGFRALESEPLDPKDPWGGTRYTRQELLETSIVSVPANPAALQVAKSMNISRETIAVVFGEQADTRRRAVALPGEHAALPPPTRGTPMTIAQQIQDTQTRLNASRDALTEFLTQEVQDPVQRDAMSNDILAVEAELRSLEIAEKALAPRVPAQQLAATTITAPNINRRPLGLPATQRTHLDFYLGMLAVRARAAATRQPIEEVLRHYYPEDEGTAIVTRAAIAGATTTGAGWAADLVVLAQGEFVNLLYPNSVFPKLSAMGTALNFGPNAGAIKIPSRTASPSIGGTFIGEAQPIPVHRFGTTSITLNPHKVGGISVYSREIANYSNPAIEALIRDSVVNDTSINVDAVLLDNVAVSAARPAGLTNGVVALTATAGGGYAAFLGDLNKLTAPFYAANAGRKLALLMNPSQRQQLVFAPGPAGAPFGWAAQFEEMFTVVSSTSIAAGSAYMVDAVDFVSVADAPEFVVSEEATLHMEDTTPLNIGTAGTPPVVAAPVQSMFQTNQIAIRMTANISWAMRRAGMVQFIATGINWGP
jgi:HK97 family phage major capsid protein